MITPSDADDDIVSLLSIEQGLAVVSLFPEASPPGAGTHAVLLDGPRGSFAISVGPEIEPTLATSWSWSANVPHHVQIDAGRVRVTRWDRPDPVARTTLAELERDTGRFFDSLRRDAVEDPRTVVSHSMDLFRRVRAMVSQTELPDRAAMTAYLALLATLNGGMADAPDRLEHLGRAFDLPDDYREIVRRLPERLVDATLRDFSRLQLGGHGLQTNPVLAMRHASGAIFQEAHHTFLASGQIDLFDYVAPVRSQAQRRGVVHFTPPPLARSLADRALGRLGDLHRRTSIAIADITCGSGAFLIECLRSLERSRYAGRVTIHGRDISPAAVDMARFAIGLAASDWPGRDRCRIDVAVQDTLREPFGLSADVMVMNPPFLSWASQDAETRATLGEVLGNAKGGRPDVSTAFVKRAVDALRDDGALAALVPASVLETAAGEAWRRQVTARHPAGLVARFDNLSIFPHATVRLGAIVVGGRGPEALEVRSGVDQDAVGDVLRALRRGARGDDVRAEGGPTWTIRPGDGSLRLPAGQPTDEAPWWTDAPGTVPLGELFTIRQAIRSGLNGAFVLTQLQHRALPEDERAAFRPAIASNDIRHGRLISHVMVFYPYSPPWNGIGDEAELRRRLPVYAERYLFPHRDRLRGRAGFGDRWWLLTRPHEKQSERHRSVFVSKYFAGPGGIALDVERNTLMVQGFSWTPTSRLLSLTGEPRRGTVPAPLFAYLAILNSEAFFEIVAASSNVQRGGQFDMSSRYIAGLPLVDLAQVAPRERQTIADLATVGRALHLGTVATLADDALESVERAVRALFRRADPGPMSARTGDALPPWLDRFLEAEKDPTGRKQRVEVLVELRQRAKAGAFEEIDDALRQVDLGRLNDFAVNTLLRGTFAMRLHLPSWASFRDRAAEVFRERGRDPDAVMVGLYR